MNADMVELGRRAVACVAWRPVQGMADASGEVVVRVHDDGTVTRKITSVDGRAVDYKPTPIRHMNEAERRVNLDDGLSALGFLLGVIQAEPEDWTVAS